jgi:hypothetical protein
MENLKKLMLDYKAGRSLGQFSKSQASEAIRKEMIELMGTDKPDFRTYRKHKPEIFQILEEVLDVLITDGILNSSFFEQFVEYRDLNLGDENLFYVEDKSMLTIAEVAGGHLNLRRQKLNIGDTFSVKTKWYGAKVYADFLRFISGRIDFEALVRKIDEAMRVQMAESIYSAFMASSQYLPSEFTHTGSFDGTEMNNIVQHIQTANNNSGVIVAGTRNALRAVKNSYNNATGNTFLVSEAMKDQIHNNGLLEVWEGLPLLEIPQVHVPNTFDFMFDDKKLFILPANTKPIKVVREGQSIIDETPAMQNMDMSMEYTFLTRYGIATIFNVMYGQYNLA